MGSTKTMKLVRSNAPEVARCVASAGALANWWSAAVLAYLAAAWGVLIALAVSLTLPARVAGWVGVPAFAALSAYLLWRGRSPRRNWEVAACAGQVYIRLSVTHRKGRGNGNEPDVLALEASEIASMSIRRREVLLRGPRPKILEWLVIELAQEVAEDIASRLRPLLTPANPGKALLVAIEDGRLTMKWECFRPPLPLFLQQVARECASLVIGQENRSELDLNGIWNRLSLRLSLNAQQRHMLVQASQLGFRSRCVLLLSRYSLRTFPEARRYLAEIEKEETGTGQTAVQR